MIRAAEPWALFVTLLFTVCISTAQGRNTFRESGTGLVSEAAVEQTQTPPATPAIPRTMRSLRKLIQAREKFPEERFLLDLEVSLVFAARSWGNCFVQDEDICLMAGCSEAASTFLAEHQPGVRLRIQGESLPQEWNIRISSFQISDSEASLTPFRLDELDQASEIPFNGLVELTTRVEEILIGPTTCTMYSWSGYSPVRLELYETVADSDLLPLLDRKIRAAGALCYQHLPDADASFPLRMMSRDQLRLPGSRAEDRTRGEQSQLRRFAMYSGQVLYSDRRSHIVIGTRTGAEIVETHFAGDLSSGTKISLRARRQETERENTSAIRSGVITVHEAGTLSPGTSVSTSSLFSDSPQPHRVTISAVLTDQMYSVGFCELQLRSEGVTVRARVPSEVNESLALRTGDHVRITGTPIVVGRGSLRSGRDNRLTLYCADSSDIQFVAAGAIQSTSQIVSGLMAGFSILAVALIWNWQLRRQVRLRTLQLNEVSTHLRTAFEAVREAVLVNDSNCRVTGFNREFVRLFGFQPREGQLVTVALQMIECQLASRDAFTVLQRSAFEEADRPLTAVLELRSPDCTLNAFTSPIVDASGTCRGNLWTFEDVTEKLRFESELLQAQKMDAIGQLSGGIAHDFNNLLTIIRSSITMIELSAAAGKSWGEYTMAAETAVDRAAELTQHLLDFSRKSRLSLKLIEVNPFIERVCMLVRRSMDCTVELIVRLSAEPVYVTVDVTRVEQVLINICINARDALPEKGGEIQLEVFRKVHHRLGNVVVIAVEDNGIGMSAELCQRIFEPFFTTKKAGRGTGLGLAMAQGVIEQHGGLIHCDSEQGRGTRFEILLPASDASQKTQAENTAPVTREISSLRVLLVDDDNLVRDFGQAILQSLGHFAITAANGREALDVLLSGREFDCVLLDLTMPEMSGKEAFFEIRGRWPDLPVAICSGYSLDTQVWLTDDLVSPPVVIPKPYRRSDLAAYLEGLKQHCRESENCEA